MRFVISLWFSEGLKYWYIQCIYMEVHEQVIREVKEFGNGAHVFAPKEWLGEVVFVVRQRNVVSDNYFLTIN